MNSKSVNVVFFDNDCREIKVTALQNEVLKEDINIICKENNSEKEII